jgi:hypothetical protein
MYGHDIRTCELQLTLTFAWTYIVLFRSRPQRFGVMIHRVQAPENTIPEPVAQNTNTATVAGGTNTADPENGNTTTANTTPATPAFSIMNVIRADLQRHPNLRWIVPAVIIVFLLLSGIVPQATPIFLGALYSFWVPQIWRNARRGNRKALQWKFVIGQSIARLGLPLCTSQMWRCPAFDAILTDNFE